jgi:hypothetical protein
VWPNPRFASRKFRYRQAFAPILALTVTLIVGASTACSAAGDLSGTVETFLAFDLSGGGFAIQTDSDTYGKLKVDYILSGWTFRSLSTFSVDGLVAQEFLGSGSLGLIVLSNRLLFSPIAGAGPGLTSDTKSANGVEHQYDFGTTSFIDWVSVTSITVVPTGAQWRIKTSLDGVAWDWQSELFTGSFPSGQIRVGRVARYVTIYVTTAGGYIDASALTASISSESWTGTARYTTSGVTLTAGWTLATGGSSLSFGIIGSHAGNLPVEGTIYFDILQPDCSLCFDRFTGKFVSSLSCIDRITSALKISKTGFDEVSFAATGLDLLGLASITFDARLAFSLTEKSVTLTPVLNLGDTTCFTLYTSLVAGPAGAMEITGLSTYGIRLLWSLNGVEFESLTYLDDIHYTKENYWEMFRISVDGDTCCGGSFDFEVKTHFGTTHTSLFDWAETEFEAEFGLGESYVFSTYMSFTSAGVNDLIFGFVFSW